MAEANLFSQSLKGTRVKRAFKSALTYSTQAP